MSKNCDKTIFLDKPKNTFWSLSDGEITLFQKKVKICEKTNVSIESSIAAEIDILNAADAYNVYKLYIDDKEVTNSGYEAVSQPQVGSQNLETSSLTWVGTECCCFVVKLTAQIFRTRIPPPPPRPPPPPPPIISSNIIENEGNFDLAKGAFLRINLLSTCSAVYFFKNIEADWSDNNPAILFKETIWLDPYSQVYISSSIATEILGVNPNNIYELYINGEKVVNTQYSGNNNAYHLETATLIWSGSANSCTKIKIKLVATTFPGSANVNISEGNFRDAKGAFMSVIVNKCEDALTKFKDKPKNVFWEGNETVLYKKTFNVKETIMVNGTISAITPNPDYNIYRLYINDKQVCQSGFKSFGQFPSPSPSLGIYFETSSLVWSGCIKDLYDCQKCNNPRIKVKITAQTKNGQQSRVDQAFGGAFLSIYSYD